MVSQNDITGRISNWWALAGIGGSVLVSIVTSAIYVHDLIAKIDKLEKQVTAINKALTFGGAGESRDVVFNGPAAGTLCPDNTVLREVRISYKDITTSPNGSIRCVSLKPTGVD